MARLAEPGVSYASLSAERGITSGQLKGWHPELLAAGSATAIAETKAEAAELAQPRRDVKRLKEGEEDEERPRGGRFPDERGDAESIHFFRTMGSEDMNTRFAFIVAHARVHAIRLLCRVLHVSRSWFHAWHRAAE